MSGQGFDDLDDVASATHSIVIGKIREDCCEREFTRKKNICFKVQCDQFI